MLTRAYTAYRHGHQYNPAILAVQTADAQDRLVASYHSIRGPSIGR